MDDVTVHLIGDDPTTTLCGQPAASVVLRHAAGTITIEAGRVVVRIAGKRRTADGETVSWEHEFPAPVGRADIEWRLGQVTVFDGDRPIQTVFGCRWREFRRFRAYLDDAAWVAYSAPPCASYRPVPAVTVSDCSTCGAPGKRSDAPCRYCGV